MFRKRGYFCLYNFVCIQLSHLTWLLNIKPKARSLTFFSLAVIIPEMPREFPSMRWNWLGENLRQIVSLFGFLYRPHFLPQTMWPKTVYCGQIVKPRNWATEVYGFTKASWCLTTTRRAYVRYLKRTGKNSKGAARKERVVFCTHYISKMEQNPAEKYRALFNIPKQNCMRNLDCFWQRSLLAKFVTPISTNHFGKLTDLN